MNRDAGSRRLSMVATVLMLIGMAAVVRTGDNHSRSRDANREPSDASLRETATHVFVLRR
jgi:hypothetical protein